jgi:hypothetical protein
VPVENDGNQGRGEQEEWNVQPAVEWLPFQIGAEKQKSKRKGDPITGEVALAANIRCQQQKARADNCQKMQKVSGPVLVELLADAEM